MILIKEAQAMESRREGKQVNLFILGDEDFSVQRHVNS